MKKTAMMMMMTILLTYSSGSVRADENLYTNVYVVPSDFQTIEVLSPKQDAENSIETAEEKSNRLSKRTAVDILKSAGISFREGASATYNSKSSKLIVRNTEDQMKLVEAFIDWVKKR